MAQIFYQFLILVKPKQFTFYFHHFSTKSPKVSKVGKGNCSRFSNKKSFIFIHIYWNDSTNTEKILHCTDSYFAEL